MNHRRSLLVAYSTSIRHKSCLSRKIAQKAYHLLISWFRTLIFRCEASLQVALWLTHSPTHWLINITPFYHSGAGKSWIPPVDIRRRDLWFSGPEFIQLIFQAWERENDRRIDSELGSRMRGGTGDIYNKLIHIHTGKSRHLSLTLSLSLLPVSLAAPPPSFRPVARPAGELYVVGPLIPSPPPPFRPWPGPPPLSPPPRHHHHTTASSLSASHSSLTSHKDQTRAVSDDKQ